MHLRRNWSMLFGSAMSTSRAIWAAIAGPPISRFLGERSSTVQKPFSKRTSPGAREGHAARKYDFVVRTLLLSPRRRERASKFQIACYPKASVKHANGRVVLQSMASSTFPCCYNTTVLSWSFVDATDVFGDGVWWRGRDYVRSPICTVPPDPTYGVQVPSGRMG